MADHPLSIKGVLIHDGRVLLLLNERGQWDLPGGRPNPGENRRAALAREVREETGLDVAVGARLDEHLFEVLPQRFVRIAVYGCRLAGSMGVNLSYEHLEFRWSTPAELGPVVADRHLAAGYVRAIRAAFQNELSGSTPEPIDEKRR
jgi:8-oxo-dGTP pyrophosphatase MutT (NUDIX family)